MSALAPLSILDWLTEPWQRVFMQHALLAILTVGIVCGVIGCFVVLRGMAFVGDAFAHAVFPGVVIAFLLGSSIFVGALGAAIIVSLGIGVISQGGRPRRYAHDTGASAASRGTCRCVMSP